ncbi:MAG: nucleoside triphosphate pyrophosphohydrolase [Corallococcus sp.]|nr:nucleoside triphosphate pyrophosphohydrolase [Corallococcus sp.]
MKKTYNKLVRNKIPEIIDGSGKDCIISVLSDEEYAVKLETKLDEEFSEYRAEGSVEELADMAEVIYAIANAKGVSREEFENIRLQKLTERGGFDKKIFLKEVITRD